MLKADYYIAPSDLDQMIFAKLLPADPYVRRLKAAIDFEPLRALMADCYAAGMGAPAEDPVRMLKLSLLQFQYDLSESQVLRQAQVNVHGKRASSVMKTEELCQVGNGPASLFALDFHGTFAGIPP